ncbi:MAG: ribosome recycling factor [Myxococcales bacterium]|jgi:ribosome recycling factor|nr:ribosome recycling factor [Myxococcales bacterium]
MLEEVFQSMNTAVEKSRDALKQSLSRIRTGRANAAMLDPVRVDYYGTRTPLNQLATISTPEPRLLLVKPFDRTAVSAIEKAIQAADLGLNPTSDGDLIRIPVPALTEERRKEMVKLVRKTGEEGKVVVRNHRRDGNEAIKKLETASDISKDEAARALKQMQDITDEAIAEVDKLVKAKEDEVTEI